MPPSVSRSATGRTRDLLPWQAFTAGFSYDGKVIPLIVAAGIWQPQALDVPISITTSPKNPYGDSIGSDGLLEHLPARRALGRSGRFERVGLIPQDAWLEAVVNAVVHRSYSVSGDHIRVEIFDDRVEVDSPGRFPGIANTSDPLDVTRFARNPRIARVCADLAFGQELGEGIRRIFEEMRLAGLDDPEYVQTSGSVRLTLSSTAVDRELEARLPPGSRDLVRLIREAGRVSTGDLVEAAGRSRPVGIRQLNALREAGVIRWVGNSPKDPRAYWTIHLE